MNAIVVILFDLDFTWIKYIGNPIPNPLQIEIYTPNSLQSISAIKIFDPNLLKIEIYNFNILQIENCSPNMLQNIQNKYQYI